MARLSDHLKRLEETTRSESEAIEKICQDELETLRSKLSVMQTGVLESIRSDMDQSRGQIAREIQNWHEDLSRSVIEARQRAASVRAVLLRPVIAWAAVLILLLGTSWYLGGETRKTWNEYQAVKGETERLESSRTTFEVGGKLYVKVDPSGVFQGQQTGKWYAPVSLTRDGYYAQVGR